MPRRICITTGSRADYGHLRWLARLIADDPALELRLLVTGSHLSRMHGFTVEEIERDGFAIDERVDMQLFSDAPEAIARSVGLAIVGMADALKRMQPDLVVLLGDRYEMLAAAQAALFLELPIAHLHGGERSDGSYDDSMRHAISKLAHLHFVAAQPYARRLRQMGEMPERIFVVGAPGLDALQHETLPSRDELLAELDLPAERPFIVVTYHPATTGALPPGKAIAELLTALENVPELSVIITGVNADAGREPIAQAIREWSTRYTDRVRSVTSLGQRRYLGAVKYAAAVVGNSSSGLIEAPALETPTVNIGSRQHGRLTSSSVVDCDETATAIEKALRRVIAPSFRVEAARRPPAYGTSGASERIKSIIASIELGGLRHKSFCDLTELPS